MYESLNLVQTLIVPIGQVLLYIVECEKVPVTLFKSRILMPAIKCTNIGKLKTKCYVYTYTKLIQTSTYTHRYTSRAKMLYPEKNSVRIHVYYINTRIRMHILYP